MPLIRSDVRLVRVLATVKDADGALVGSLEKTDFAVRDNGVPQQISVFERQTDQPLSVAVLIDNSGSTAKDLKYETESVMRFVRALLREGNPEDAVSLYSFNWEIVQSERLHTQSVRDRKIPARSARRSRHLALRCHSARVARHQDRKGRKILVIVTDGGDTISRADFNRAVEAAQLADAVIYPILVVPITNDAGRNVGGENALTTFSLRTGGRVFQPALGAALDQSLRPDSARSAHPVSAGVLSDTTCRSRKSAFTCSTSRSRDPGLRVQSAQWILWRGSGERAGLHAFAQRARQRFDPGAEAAAAETEKLHRTDKWRQSKPKPRGLPNRHSKRSNT